MKKTIYVHAQLAEWSEEGYILTYWDYEMSQAGGPRVATVEVDFDMPSKAELANGFVGQLRGEQQKIRADCEVKVNEIEHQIGKLLAIEDKSK